MGEHQGFADRVRPRLRRLPPHLDADGTLTVFDFLAFGSAFDAGCEQEGNGQ